MKAKLTKITGIYTLLDDNDRMIASDDVDMQKDYQIGKLSKQNCDEIFGVVDVKKLARELHPCPEDAIAPIRSINGAFRNGFVAGFNKAMELNKDKVFTLEDMEKAFDYGYGYADEKLINRTDDEECENTFEKLIQSLQQPKEIEVMIVMETISDGLDEIAQPQYAKVPKLDSSGNLIIKKK